MVLHQRMEGLLTPHTTMLLLAMVALAGLALYRSLLRPLFKYFYIRRPGSGYVLGSESSHLLSGQANVPVITALLVLDGQLTPSELKSALVSAGIPHRRFQRLAQCVSRESGRHVPFDVQRGDWPAYFVHDSELDLDRHIRWLTDDEEECWDHARLESWLSSVINTPPSFERPPWEMLVVRRFSGGGSALVVRVHHVLTDGLALVALMDAITTHHAASSAVTVVTAAAGGGGGAAASADKPAASDPKADSQQQGGKAHKKENVIAEPPPPSGHSLESAGRVGLKPTTGSAGRSSSWIGGLVSGVWLACKLLWEMPGVLKRDYVEAPDEHHALKRHHLSGVKRVAWDGSALSLTRVKHAKSALGVTVNDLLLACATGALRHTLLTHQHHDQESTPTSASSAGSTTESTDSTSSTGEEGGGGSAGSPSAEAVVVPDVVRFFAPMSARATPLHTLKDLNNSLSVLSLALPTGLADRSERLHHIVRLTSSLKSSTVPLGLSLMWRPLDYLPRGWLQAQSDFLCAKATGVLTNVPGPSHTRALAGHKVRELMFWVPAVGSIGMVLSVLSYHHKLALGLVVDASLGVDPSAFLSAMVSEFRHYEATATAIAHASTATTTRPHAAAGEGSASSNKQKKTQ